jgi:hypothetical protein
MTTKYGIHNGHKVEFLSIGKEHVAIKYCESKKIEIISLKEAEEASFHYKVCSL